MVVKIMSETHWTQRLFVENAELYLPEAKRTVEEL
jgi:hypothetical protein